MKKMMTGVLALVMVLVMVGCGQKDNGLVNGVAKDGATIGEGTKSFTMEAVSYTHLSRDRQSHHQERSWQDTGRGQGETQKSHRGKRGHRLRTGQDLHGGNMAGSCLLYTSRCV